MRMSLKLSLQARKGAAIFLMLVITMALAGLAGAAVLMTSGASLV